MEKILNEWRKFLIQEAAPKVPFSDEFLETPKCVFHWDEDDEEHHIVLYRKAIPGRQMVGKDEKEEKFYVIGYVSAMQITEPGDPRMQCIPNTFQISAIYVEPELQGQGYGRILYDLAFAAVPLGAGLTSDKYSGSLPKAKGAWEKMANSPEFKKRETDTAALNSKGKMEKSTEFDYTGKRTPEIPEDDCNTPYKRQQKSNASHFSLEKVNKSAGISMLMKMKANHEKNFFPSGQEGLEDSEIETINLNKTEFEKKVFTFASYRFGQIYSKLANKTLN